jgi:hypothetical protein
MNPQVKDHYDILERYTPIGASFVAEDRAASCLHKDRSGGAAEPQNALFRERYRPRSAQAVPSAGAGGTGSAARSPGPTAASMGAGRSAGAGVLFRRR